MPTGPASGRGSRRSSSSPTRSGSGRWPSSSAVFLVASTVAIVALVTISVALAALVATRYVLPAADRLEATLDAARSASALEIADSP